jgi:hypothetical protein
MFPMRILALALVAIVAISAPTLAQCSTLAITGTINAGQTLSIDVSGAPANSIVFIAVGEAGSTNLPFPGQTGGLTLGVAQPFIILPIGMSDSTGHVALSVEIPANLPAGVIQDHTYTAQALSLSFSMMSPWLSFCVSNTTSLVSGAG